MGLFGNTREVCIVRFVRICSIILVDFSNSRLLRLHIDSLKNKKELYRRISSGYEVKIDNVSSGCGVVKFIRDISMRTLGCGQSNRTEDLEIVNGHFLSPLAAYEPGLLPPESENAR